MAKIYLNELTTLITPLVAGRFEGVELEFKHFFSGAAVYVNGSICITLTPVGLALKLPEESRQLLIHEQRAKPLQYFPNAPIKKSYVVLHESVLSDTESFRQWIMASIEYVLSTN